MLLRRDIHNLFDKRRLVLVPKQGKLVIHVLGSDAGTPKLLTLYHNRSPLPLSGVSIEFLYARFAWAIFCDEYLPFFRTATQQYSLLLYDPKSTKCAQRDKVRSGEVAGLTRISRQQPSHGA